MLERARFDGPLPPESGTGVRRRRVRHPVRARVEPVRKLPHLELQRGRALYPPMADDEPRPKTRAECERGARPCPFVSCRHHLYVDVMPTGSIRYVFPDLEVDEIPETCALDIADKGGQTLDGVARLLNVTRERVRQMEASILRRLAAMRAVAKLKGHL